MFLSTFRNKIKAIPSIVYFIIISLFVHLYFLILIKGFRSEVIRKDNPVNVYIAKKSKSKNISSNLQHEVTKVNNTHKDTNKASKKPVGKTSEKIKDKLRDKKVKNNKPSKKNIYLKQNNATESIKKENNNKYESTAKINDSDNNNEEEKINTNEEMVASISNKINEEDLIENYLNYIYTKIKENTFYPKLALRREIEGTVYVKFIVTENGEIKNIKIYKSSGFNILDKAGIEIAKSCSPLKIPPKELEITAPVVFSLKK